MTNTLSAKEIKNLNLYWRTANYLSVGQIYLRDNPLLKESLKIEHIKPRLLGHWGTTPGLNFIYAHLNRMIKKNGLDLIFIAGPGHGGPAVVANAYLEGTYSEIYPKITQDENGLKKFFTQFSYPGGIPSHVAPETPGSIHEGGELGYALAHAYGAVFDNPNLIAACVVGDGEAETGPLAASWHSNKFLNPANDGAVLPILHLNGYKIANPTVLARISRQELSNFFKGCGYVPIFVEGDKPDLMHQKMGKALEQAFSNIKRIQLQARRQKSPRRPAWPMIILRSPKGWTGPKNVDGIPVEGTFRAHQVPLSELAQKPTHLRMLEDWMRSYKPEELFDFNGRIKPAISKLSPQKTKRMSKSPHANGGLLLKSLKMPDFRNYALSLSEPGEKEAEATKVLGMFLRDILKLNRKGKNFRVFGPDETASNRLSAVFEETKRAFLGEIIKTDENLSPDGRVLEVLSEHLCQGWLEGYLLTGRHGLFSCYEAFIHIIDSMFNQHAKWLKVTRKLPWRRPIASLNYLLTSHVWRQDHNGFSHQDPGFIDHVVNKKADVIRVYLPPDANTLLSVADHCLRSLNYINVIVAGKQPAPQWLNIEEAHAHCEAGLGIWNWAGNGDVQNPDCVLACAGDVPTLETLAAAQMIKEFLPKISFRVVNVVDLMTLQPETEHPHGLSDERFDQIFTTNKPIIFAFHGYPWLIHRLTYRRTNQGIHVRGYKEEGTTTTPFDMTVLNEIDRFHLVIDVLDRIANPGPEALKVRRMLEEKLGSHQRYIREHGEDLPEVRNWKWRTRFGEALKVG